MRIIAGKAGRVAIQVPPAVARPTTDFVRQALFSILSECVADARMLDLFAGSGAIGLEALSRGAASCLFVDDHRNAATTIQNNLTKTKLAAGRVVRSDVLAFLRRDAGIYDIITADPPYWKHHGDTDHVKSLLDSALLAPRLAPGGWFVAEASSQQTPHTADGWHLADHRTYGSSALWFYQKSETP
jgi:16S rRNA (guanine966-N2)-methyltransferase